MTARILVTNPITFFATRLIHDLGKRGVDITAADNLWISAGKASWRVASRLRIPDLGSDPGRYLEAILKELRRRKYDLLLPTFEESLLFAEYADELRKYTQLFLPPFEMMYSLHHKPSLHNLCESLQLPSPPTVTIRDREELATAAATLGFPLVLKLPTSNNAVGMMYCSDMPNLHSNFDRLVSKEKTHTLELPFLQKKIPGKLFCSLCYCSDGVKFAEVIYRSFRTFPESGGTAAHRESVHHEEISRITTRLVEETNWSGFLGFDFIVEDETGIPYVIDANVRATPGIHLGYLCGLDWSQLILDLIAGKSPVPQEAQPGVHAHNMLLDISWLLEGLLPRTGPIWKFPSRCFRFLFPGWTIHSRDDMFDIREFGSVMAIGVHAFYSLGLSVLSGRQPGDILLKSVNYNTTAAEAFRRNRLGPPDSSAAIIDPVQSLPQLEIESGLPDTVHSV